MYTRKDIFNFYDNGATGFLLYKLNKRLYKHSDVSIWHVRLVEMG